MKVFFLAAIVVLTTSTSFAQHSLEKLWESDSVTLKGPESALFDSGSKSLYVSSMNAGSIVRMGLDGKIIKSDWVTGLKSNMGSALYKGHLYTTSPSGIVVIDVEKAAVIRQIPIDGIGMLNDVAVDSKGIVYTSDTRTGKVYRIESDKATVFIENIPGANGLLPVGTDLYVVGSGSIHKVNTDKQVTKIADGFESGLDGIVMVGENEFVLSNYRGILYYLNADGTNQVLLDTRANRIMANDISYNSDTKTLFVPSFGKNRIIAYRLK